MKIVVFIFLIIPFAFFAQEEIVNLDSVVVTAYKSQKTLESSLNITSLKIDRLSRNGNFSLTDLIAKAPGISMLSTGVAISKPVIRGLYGNRVLVLMSGLKFDNQQWQEEHGLGLSDVGVSRVEIIKGPMSVLYGTEAVGGVLNVIEEDKPSMNTKMVDYGLKFNSNTLGESFQLGVKSNKGNKWYRLRVGIENNGDYSDGNNKRVLNSCFDGYQLKSTFGFQKKNWTSTNNYMGTFNRFGFIFNDVYTFVSPDERWSRRLNENPCHLVFLNALVSENKFHLKQNSELFVNLGIQSNKRMENEGGGAISLDMHLLTFQYLVKWEKKLNSVNKLILSDLGSIENNMNYGARKIIPDANLIENNFSIYLESKYLSRLVFENGVGFGEKWIQTFLTNSVNSSEKEIGTFFKKSPFYNIFSGIAFNPTNQFNLKFNISTGVRVPNLAELSSNGLHEGIFTYEIGNPLLKNEQNITGNLILNYKKRWMDFGLTPFYNYFKNYVYLNPTNEKWFGFPVYRYQQVDAFQYGGEIHLGLNFAKQCTVSIDYSGMVSRTITNENIAYTPAQKIATTINYCFQEKKVIPFQFYVQSDFYFAQNKVSFNELKTPNYWIVNSGISKTFQASKMNCISSISVNNLFNNAYYDHLSRFKNFGLLNIGRNISINLRIKLNEQTTKTKKNEKKN